MTTDSIISGVQTVAQQLYDKHGKLESKALVDAARPKDSPAHDAFEWDNKKAGDEYRLIQARKYIRQIVITREDEPERLVHVPSIQRDAQDTRDGHYQVPSVLVTMPGEFERALQAAMMRVKSANKALQDLHQAAETDGRDDQAALISQMAKATLMFSQALESMH